MTRDWLAVYLSDDLRQALLTMARADYRTPVQQLVWLLRQEAERRGLRLIESVTGEAQSAGANRSGGR